MLFNYTYSDKTEIMRLVQRCNQRYRDADELLLDRLKTERPSRAMSVNTVTLV